MSPPTPGTAPGGSLSAGTQARRCAGLVKRGEAGRYGGESGGLPSRCQRLAPGQKALAPRSNSSVGGGVGLHPKHSCPAARRAPGAAAPFTEDGRLLACRGDTCQPEVRVEVRWGAVESRAGGREPGSGEGLGGGASQPGRWGGAPSPGRPSPAGTCTSCSSPSCLCLPSSILLLTPQKRKINTSTSMEVFLGFCLSSFIRKVEIKGKGHP